MNHLDFDVQDALLVAGPALVLCGVAAYSVPAALILFGLLMIAAAIRLGPSPVVNKETK